MVAGVAACPGRLGERRRRGGHPGHIVFANAPADALLGRVRLGADIDDYNCMHGLFTMEGRPYPAQDLPLPSAVLRRELTRHVLIKVRRPDGESTLISVSGQSLFDGEAVKRVGVMKKDVSEELRRKRT